MQHQPFHMNQHSYQLLDWLRLGDHGPTPGPETYIHLDPLRSIGWQASVSKRRREVSCHLLAPVCAAVGYKCNGSSFTHLGQFIYGSFNGVAKPQSLRHLMTR